MTEIGAMDGAIHDLVIRGGTVFDGMGGAPFVADVAVAGGTIVEVGAVAGRGREEIDAAGMIVTPGFVDLHTHFDAQAMWDPVLAPASWHGVTTVVMGNCAVGFAPARPEARPWLVEVMESVEEIPANVMAAGLSWDWQTFPEYLDALDRRRHTVDIGTQLPHIALRGYVMGERAARDEPATPADIDAMSDIVEEALRAGALGIACSRTDAHRMPDGRVVPGSNADADEVIALAGAMGRVGGRVMQYLGNAADLDRDIPVMMELARRSRSAVHFIMSDRGWRRRIAAIEAAEREGLTLFGHVAPRAVGMVVHWRAVEQPFHASATCKSLSSLPWDQRLARLRDPDIRERIVAETAADAAGLFATMPHDRLFEVADYPDYEPDPATDSLAVRAAAAGQDVIAYAYDVFLRREGTGMIYVPLANYAAGDFREVREILLHPRSRISLADGGAHSTRVCDAGTPTFMLVHWARDRTRGETLPLAFVIRSLTWDTASSYGLHDRGRIAPGYLADLNVLDFERLRLPAPYPAFDLPAGGQRLLQRAEGYVATIKRGEVTFRNGEHCGRYPGTVIRGPQRAPADRPHETLTAA